MDEEIIFAHISHFDDFLGGFVRLNYDTLLKFMDRGFGWQYFDTILMMSLIAI